MAKKERIVNQIFFSFVINYDFTLFLEIKKSVLVVNLILSRYICKQP